MIRLCHQVAHACNSFQNSFQIHVFFNDYVQFLSAFRLSLRPIFNVANSCRFSPDIEIPHLATSTLTNIHSESEYRMALGYFVLFNSSSSRFLFSVLFFIKLCTLALRYIDHGGTQDDNAGGARIIPKTI